MIVEWLEARKHLWWGKPVGWPQVDPSWKELARQAKADDLYARSYYYLDVINSIEDVVMIHWPEHRRLIERLRLEAPERPSAAFFRIGNAGAQLAG